MKYHRILYQTRKNYPLRKEVRTDTYYRIASLKKLANTVYIIRSLLSVKRLS